MAEACDPVIEDRFSGFKVVKADPDCGILSGRAGGVVKESSRAPFCGVPLGGVDEALDEGLGRVWGVLFHKERIRCCCVLEDKWATPRTSPRSRRSGRGDGVLVI